MSVLERLLEEGRKILLAHDEEDQRRISQAREAREAQFKQALLAAKKEFGALAGELPVCPGTMPDDFSQDREQEFTVSPFPGVPIRVEVFFNLRLKEWMAKSRSAGYGEETETPFCVPSVWSSDVYEETGIFVSCWQNARTLAIAVAMCEAMKGKPAQAQADYEQRLAAKQARVAKRKQAEEQPSLADRLLAVLEEVVQSYQRSES